MRRTSVLLASLLAIVLVAPACDPDPGGSTTTTWEWMFRGTATAPDWGNPLMRRHCEILWTYDNSNGRSGVDLQAANQAAVADMERLTGVNIDYAGARANLSSLTMGANFPIEVGWADYDGTPAAWSVPSYDDSYLPRDLIGGFIEYDKDTIIPQADLTDMAKHEWGHQFNIGDVYDNRLSLRFDASAAFQQQVATDMAYLDVTQRMGDHDNAWGSGDKEGLWEAGGRSRADDCLRLIRAGTGTWAWRMYRALYGAPTFDKLVWYEVKVRGDAEQAAAEMLAEPGGSTWTAKSRDVFLTDAWTALTGAAPTTDQMTVLRAVHDNEGRAKVLADMANTTDAKNHLPKTQGITLVFANVIQRVPTSAEITQFASTSYEDLRNHLYEDTTAGANLYRP